jgi:uncharacterized protein (TIGR00369 family)
MEQRAPETDTDRVRTFTWDDPAETARAFAGMSGLESLHAMMRGQRPVPPMAKLMGFEILEAESARVVFGLRLAEWMYNPMGIVHGGVAATILDTVMGCAVTSTLPAGVGHTTTDIQVRYVRPTTVQTGRLLAEGRLIHGGRRTATCEGALTVEESGKLVAHATSGFLLLR